MTRSDPAMGGADTSVGTLAQTTARVRHDGATEHQAAAWVPTYEASRNVADKWPSGMRVPNQPWAVHQQIADEAPHPCPGAQPGELIAAGPGYRWRVYEVTDGTMAAAVYLDTGLLRRDMRGWWVAGPAGGRVPVPDAVVAELVGSIPDAWPVLDEQAPLLGAEELDLEEVA